MSYTKITNGFVVQTFGDDGQCISQEFVAGHPVEYENIEGESIEVPDNETYQPFNMEQPKIMKWQEIQDNKVRAIWRCTEKDCDCDKEDCAIEPDWYQHNGTPMCEGDRDMSYIKTELDLSAK